MHLHTYFSDGTYTPEELIAESKNSGLSAIAICDHDNVGGIDPAIKSAKEKDIEVLPAIELSAEYEGIEIHILGYLIDYKNKALVERLDLLRKNRIERVYKIIGKLKDMGITINPETVFEFARFGTVGRLHIAMAMVKEGAVKSVVEAFQKYIGDKCPAYVLGFRFSPCEAINLIRDSGGLPVLAHPYIITNDELIPRFVDCGLMGLEVYYPEHSQSETNFYLDLANRYDLLITGGSDFHGSAKPDVAIGCIKIPYDLVEKLKVAKGRL